MKRTYLLLVIIIILCTLMFVGCKPIKVTGTITTTTDTTTGNTDSNFGSHTTDEAPICEDDSAKVCPAGTEATNANKYKTCIEEAKQKRQDSYDAIKAQMEEAFETCMTQSGVTTLLFDLDMVEEPVRVDPTSDQIEPVIEEACVDKRPVLKSYVSVGGVNAYAATRDSAEAIKLEECYTQKVTELNKKVEAAKDTYLEDAAACDLTCEGPYGDSPYGTN